MSRDRELMTVAGRHTDDTVADLPTAGPSVDPLAAAGQENGYQPPADGVDLSADPFDDDLADELKASQPARRMSRTTFALGGALLIVGGFLGGVLVQKNVGTASTSALPAGAAAGVNARGGFGGAAGVGATAQPGTGAAAAASTTTGTVTLVDGTTVYLTTADGQVITVKTSSTTTVRLEQAITLKDVAAGATVTVRGTANADGVITASQVTTPQLR